MARAPSGAAVSTASVDAMRRAHRQIMQLARLEQKFSAKPKAWLDWPAVLTARARAVRTYELRKEEEGGPGARARLFDAALLTWLTVVPPDRVGVARKLQLGVTLKPTAGGGFELGLLGAPNETVRMGAADVRGGRAPVYAETTIGADGTVDIYNALCETMKPTPAIKSSKGK